MQSVLIAQLNYDLLPSDNSKACPRQYCCLLCCPIDNNNVTIIVGVAGT